VALTVRAFADLAGGDDADCPGCDGRFDEADELRAAELGLRLPRLLVAVYDPADESETATKREDWLVMGPALGTYATEICDVALPLVVELSPPAGWSSCSGAGLEQTLSEPGPAQVDFPLTVGCPAPSPTAGSDGTPAPGDDATTPSPEPTEAPSGDVGATPDPLSTVEPAPAPTLPSGPSPP
jgi:hypothetical protein